MPPRGHHHHHSSMHRHHHSSMHHHHHSTPVNPDAMTGVEITANSKNPGHPNFRNWALQPVPTMQVGAAALGYPDSLKVTKRHEVPPTVIVNEFTAAGVTQDCADDLARIINDAFAGMWPERKEYYGAGSVPLPFKIMLGVMTCIFLFFPWIPVIVAGVFFMLIAYVFILPFFGVIWSGIIFSSPKYLGPTFMLGMKALENAQPALRECLVRHGVNGTVRPAREMEGLLNCTFCTQSIARFWVRLEVSTPQTNPQVVQTFMAGLPVVPQFYAGYFSRTAFSGYQQNMATINQMMNLGANMLAGMPQMPPQMMPQMAPSAPMMAPMTGMPPPMAVVPPPAPTNYPTNYPTQEWI